VVFGKSDEGVFISFNLAKKKELPVHSESGNKQIKKKKVGGEQKKRTNVNSTQWIS
jgi:hypothetical protein